MKAFWFEFVALALVVDGCTARKSDISKRISLEADSIRVQCELKDFRVGDADNEPYTLVYGSLYLKNHGATTKSYNLNDYVLVLSKQQIGHIYINSTLDVLITTKRLQPGEAKRFQVYWGFNGTLTRDTFDSVFVRYERDRDSTIIFQ